MIGETLEISSDSQRPQSNDREIRGMNLSSQYSERLSNERNQNSNERNRRDDYNQQNSNLSIPVNISRISNYSASASSRNKIIIEIEYSRDVKITKMS